MRLALIAAPLLALPLLALTQDPSPAGEAPEGQAPTTAPADDPDAWDLPEAWQGLLGTWQLGAYLPGDVILPENSVHGYAVFTEGFLTILLHAAPSVAPEAGTAMLAQAGLYRWRMTAEGLLQAATMIGHGNMEGDLTWEPPNEPREFRPLLVGDDLELLRSDGGRLIWRRVTARAFPRAAIERMNELRAGVSDD